MAALYSFDSSGNESTDLFQQICTAVLEKGYFIGDNALPQPMAQALWEQLQLEQSVDFDPAGIGRSTDQHQNQFIRRDKIAWVDGKTAAEQMWLAWTSKFQQAVNRRLFLGLHSFESHFACYQPGDFYKKHLDAFRGQRNRVLTLVCYLNPGWTLQDGGEIVLYSDQDPEQELTKVLPAFGTLVCFLSEDFPHEVLVTNRQRYSITGWYRLNATNSTQLDPPR